MRKSKKIHPRIYHHIFVFACFSYTLKATKSLTTSHAKMRIFRFAGCQNCWWNIKNQCKIDASEKSTNRYPNGSQEMSDNDPIHRGALERFLKKKPTQILPSSKVGGTKEACLRPRRVLTFTALDDCAWAFLKVVDNLGFELSSSQLSFACRARVQRRVSKGAAFRQTWKAQQFLRLRLL